MPKPPDTINYRVSHASRDDRNEGWVWIKNEELEKKIEGKRRIVKIEKIESEAGDARESKPVYCEALYADDLFVLHYEAYCAENRELIRRSAKVVKGTGSDSCCAEDRCPTDKQVLEGCQASNVTGNSSKSEDPERRIFISAWYRYVLGIPKQKEGEPDPCRLLEITMPKNKRQALYWQFLACVKHPQIVVALGTVLGLIGFFLGIGGFGLGLIGVRDLIRDLGEGHTNHAKDNVNAVATTIGWFGFILALVSVLALVFVVLPFYWRAKRGILSEESVKKTPEM